MHRCLSTLNAVSVHECLLFLRFQKLLLNAKPSGGVSPSEETIIEESSGLFKAKVVVDHFIYGNQHANFTVLFV